MAYGTLEKQVLLDVGYKLAEDIDPYTFVALDGNGELVAAGDGADAIGVLDEQTGNDEYGRVMIDGIVPIKIGTAGTLAVGDPVAVDANGQADAGTTADPVVAYLKQAPNADGDIVQARISDLIDAEIA